MIAAPTPPFWWWSRTSTRGSPVARATAAVPSVDASSTTMTRSTNGGMPAIVVPTSVSSLCAGTTTATRLPSSTKLTLAREPAGDGLPEEGGEDPEQESDEGADDDGVALAAGRHLRDPGRRQHERVLDVLGLQDQRLLALPVGEQLVETLLHREGEERAGEVASGDVRLRPLDRVDLLLVPGDRLLGEKDLAVWIGLERRPVDDQVRDRVRRRAHLVAVVAADGDLHERVLAVLGEVAGDRRRRDRPRERAQRVAGLARDLREQRLRVDDGLQRARIR